MRLHEAVELTVNRFLKKLPLWERVATLWGWWLFRKSFLYGTTVYVIDTLLGRDRFHMGTSPLRWMQLGAWLPKPKAKELDPESRLMIESIGFRTKEDIQTETGCLSTKYSFYSEADYPISIKPLPDDEPAPTVEGQFYPPGFFVFIKTLNALGEFSVEECTKMWKSSEIKKLTTNELLFDYGDHDGSFHIVISGAICLAMIDDEFGNIILKNIKPNEHIMSIFTILYYCIQLGTLPKPVQAYAEEDSVICEIPLEVFKSYFDEHPTEKIPFITRGLTKIRHLYFEGLYEIAGLNKQFLQKHMTDSKYKEFDVELNDANSAEKIAAEVTESLRQYLPFEDEDLKECWVGAVNGGTIISKLGRSQKTLVYVHKGELIMTNENRLKKLNKEYKGHKKFCKYIREQEKVYCISPGGFAGVWAILTGSKNYYTSSVPIGQKAIIAEIPMHIVRKIWEKHPLSIFYFVKSLLQRFSKFCRTVDFSVQWAMVAPGRVIYRNGDTDVRTFMLLSGRLRYRVFGNYTFVKKMEMEIRSKFGYYETGEWFGFVECVMGTETMQKTVVADRYSLIAILPPSLMTLLYQKYPLVTNAMTDYLASKIHKDYVYEDVTPQTHQTPFDLLARPKYSLEKDPLLTILAVFPLTNEIPGEFYCQEICRHYPNPSRFFTCHDFKEALKDRIWLKESLSSLVEWLNLIITDGDAQEVQLIVLLGVAHEINLWNTIIARQADFIQVLGSLSCSIEPYQIEQMVETEGWKAIRDFVFLHPSELADFPKNDMETRPKLNCVRPHGSGTWLIRRPWLDTHHHVRFPTCAFNFMLNLEPKYLKQFEEYKKKAGVDKHSDIARLGRWLSNTMVGLVLGGGGAKGSAQIGILEYVLQLDVPIDYICGVSIGSFVGGLYARFQDLTVVDSILRSLFKELSQPIKYMSDYTVPYTSVMRGRCMDEFVQNAFDNTRLEDLFVPYFCVTTDLSGNHSRVHKFGPMWFYVRASMTLTMIFPPMVNSIDQHLLMDGGYSEILPGNHLRQNGVKYIFAIDIGDENGIPLFNIGYECSGIKCLLQSLIPVPGWPAVPTTASFWEQLHYIAAKKYVGLVKKLDRRLVYIRPPIEFYCGKDFGKVEEMRLMAYYTTKRRFAGIRRGLPVNIIWSLLQITDPDNNVFPQIQPRKDDVEDRDKNEPPPYTSLQKIISDNDSARVYDHGDVELD